MKLFGYQNTEQSVLKDFVKNKLHHSLLITGIEGIGKRSLVYELACKILSITNQNVLDDVKNNSESWINQEIDKQGQTYKLMQSGAHPDFLFVGLEEKAIKVEAIRSIKDFSVLTPSLSKYKVVIIDDADSMNTNAQNALLKTLEEPNDNTFIFLVAHNRLLDTIFSRCREIKIPKPDYDVWEKAIQNYCLSNSDIEFYENEFEKYYILSNGSIGFAIRLKRLDGLKIYNEILGILENPVFNVEKAQELSGNIDEKSLWVFEYFLNLFFEQLIKYKTTQEVLFVLEKEQKLIMDKVDSLDVEKIFELFDYVKKTLSDLSRINLNKKHCLVVLLSKVFIILK